MRNIFKKSRFILFGILILGFITRFYLLGTVPQIPTRDEAAMGYNAFSILSAGKDEYGHKFPLYFLSFGDYKNPLYIYLTTPIIWIFGLNSFSVRFLSAICGWLTIPTVYFLVKEIFPSKSPLKNNVGLISSFLLAISFWHIFYSRMAYEALLALFLQINGIIFLLKARRKPVYYVFALILFFLAFFSYNSPIFIIPPLVLGIIYLYRKNFLQKKISFLIFIISFFGLLFGYLCLSRFLISGRSEATIFSQNYFINQMTARESANQSPPLNLQLFLRKKPYIFYKFIQNYWSVYKPSFLFFGGDGHLWHGIRLTDNKIGNVSLLTAPFFILGIIYLLSLKKKEGYLILIWLILSPLANSITQDSPNTTRLFDFLFLYLLISSIGIVFLFHKIFKKPIFLYFLCFVFILNLLNYLNVYVNDFNQKLCLRKFSSMWLCRIDEVIAKANNLAKHRKIFIVTGPDNEEPYIFWTFYNRPNPLDFSTKAIRQKNGFIRVTNYKNIYFETVPDDLFSMQKSEIDRVRMSLGDKGSLIIARPLKNLFSNVDINIIEKIRNHNGEVLWVIGEN